MLKVTVELWPFGEEESKKKIASFDIANDGTGDWQIGHYMARLSEHEPWVEKVVTGYPRDGTYVLNLVYLALKGLKDKKKL